MLFLYASEQNLIVQKRLNIVGDGLKEFRLHPSIKLHDAGILQELIVRRGTAVFARRHIDKAVKVTVKT